MITSPLPKGTKYFTTGLFFVAKVDPVTWGDDSVDMHLMKSGLAFSTKEEAEESLYGKQSI
jgi:hypothetical protein